MLLNFSQINAVVRGWQPLALATFVAASLGCWGVSSVPRVPASTAQHRIESEVIPNAELVRQPMLPESHMGRYAFRPGSDRLLVLTRITSWAQRDGRTLTGARIDANKERAWITIPLGTRVGSVLRMEELERDFLLGYDVDREGSGYYVEPNRITGTLKVVAETADSLVLDVNVQVSPEKLGAWSVRQTVTVPVTAQGIHASVVNPDAEIVTRSRHYTPIPESIEPAPAPSAPPTAIAPDAPAAPASAPQPPAAPPTTQPAW